MRSSKSRSRSKANRPRPLGNIVNRVFDSSGPEGKVRGTPQQIIDKYLVLARDAQLSNDRVAAENFLQHAEHYTRMLNEAQREMAREADARRMAQGSGGQRFDDREPRRDEGRPHDHRRDNGRPENGRPEHARADNGRPEEGRPDHARPDHARSEDTRPDDAQRHETAPASEPTRGPEALDTADTGSGLVETPEGGEVAPKPRRGRGPRKPAPDASAPDTAPADGDAGAEGASKPAPRRRSPRRPRNTTPEGAPAEAKSSVGE